MAVNEITINGVTQLTVRDTTAQAADVDSSKYFYGADGVKTAGTGSGGGGAIADLTGTTWYFNETPVFISQIDGRIFSIEFEISALGWAYSSFRYSGQTISYTSNDTSFNAYSNGGWFSPARTISITGGADATNIVFIAWLQANATQV